MLALELLAEKKIAEAAERGDLDNLPGAGQPLDLEDDTLVREGRQEADEVRSAFEYGIDTVASAGIAGMAACHASYFAFSFSNTAASRLR